MRNNYKYIYIYIYIGFSTCANPVDVKLDAHWRSRVRNTHV